MVINYFLFFCRRRNWPPSLFGLALRNGM